MVHLADGQCEQELMCRPCLHVTPSGSVWAAGRRFAQKLRQKGLVDDGKLQEAQKIRQQQFDALRGVAKSTDRVP